MEEDIKPEVIETVGLVIPDEMKGDLLRKVEDVVVGVSSATFPHRTCLTRAYTIP